MFRGQEGVCKREGDLQTFFIQGADGFFSLREICLSPHETPAVPDQGKGIVDIFNGHSVDETVSSDSVEI